MFIQKYIFFIMTFRQKCLETKLSSTMVKIARALGEGVNKPKTLGIQ